MPVLIFACEAPDYQALRSLLDMPQDTSDGDTQAARDSTHSNSKLKMALQQVVAMAEGWIGDRGTPH